METLDEFIVAAVAGACSATPSAVSPDTRLTQIGFDTASAVSLSRQIESRYGLQLPPDTVAKLSAAVTVNDVIVGMNELVTTTGLYWG